VTSDPLPIVSCDAPQIARVFQNLLENAMKYRGMEAPRIHVSSQTVGEEIVVSVCDNGMGVDPVQHEAIFEIFRRGSEARGPGNGVGLALSRRIVERHGGHMWVRSERGKGAAFFFSLTGGADA
jgi:signal transduction histidine kinase